MSEDDSSAFAASGRRRFVIGTLGISSSALLGGGWGCGDESAPEAPAAPPEGTAEAEEAAAPADATPTEAGSLLPDGKDPADFIVHGTTPLTAETRREVLGTSVITAIPHFFVRQNLPLPLAEILEDRESHPVRVEGVARPAELTLRDLRRLGLATIATVVQCSGNGRTYFEHDPSGSPWGVGAAGCAIWSGVPVRAVVEHLGGAEEGMRFLTTTGGEPLPHGVDRDDVIVERSIPIDKALDDCLLAWEMNGQPLPLSHGGPLRLIVPGYYGCNQIKFVARIALTEEESPAKIQRSGYRMRPIGEQGDPEQPSMWAMNVKSFITRPTDRLPATAGKIAIEGVAFGGHRALDSVEVSADGEQWRGAELIGPDLGPYAWRVFRAEVEAPAGSVTLYSRAKDAEGEVQPEYRDENQRGYGNDSWRDMGVLVRVCEPGDSECLEVQAEEETARAPAQGSMEPIELSQSAQRGKEIFLEVAEPSCSTCHALREAEATGNVGPSLDSLGASVEQVKSAVKNGVGTMPAFRETLTEEQIADVARYVFEVTRGR